MTLHFPETPNTSSPGSAQAEPAAPGTVRPRLWRHEWATAMATPAGFIVLLFVVFGAWLGGTWLNTGDWVFDAYQNVPELLIGIGVMVALSCGQFDLSAGMMATLSCFLTVGLTVNQGLPLWAALLVAAAVGVAGGLLNAFLVVGLRINAFIATLGTGGVFTGISTLYSGGQTISFSTSQPVAARVHWFTGTNSFGSFQERVPLALAWVLVVVLLVCLWSALRLTLADARRPLLRDAAIAALAVVIAVLVQLAGIPAQIDWTIFLLLAAALVVWIVMRHTELGRNIIATGGNPVAARLAGIRTSRLMVLVFVVSGLFAALAGMVLAADQGTAVPNIADGYLLPAYAAAFLSTVIFSNGRFHLWGTVAGGLAVVYIAQGLVTGGVPFTWTDLINGAVLIVAVALSTTLRRAIITR
jgi:ribose/xylose/arabinose/galactoside ABC-type transport system permease subunit